MKMDDDIVYSMQKCIAELKARLSKLRLIMNIKDFSVVVSTKKMKLKDLEKYKNDLLTITEDDEDVGFKYVFQTRLTKDTVNERIRAPEGMWARNETFIDNDVSLVLNRIHEHYIE